MTAAVLTLFTLSGMCALIYQMLWTRWLGLMVGNFATATATVVTVFMAGLALGNWLVGRITVTRDPKAALKLYAWLEIGLSGLAALSPVLLSSTSPWFPWMAAASDNPLLRALLCFLVLLPPTILMGGTLPALVQTLSATAPRALGPLYAFNTLGGACGPILAAFVLMPALGLKMALWSTCALNVAVAAVAFWLAQRWPAGAPGARTPPVSPPSSDKEQGPLKEESKTISEAAWLPYVLAGFSGALSLAFEIALSRAFNLTITGGSVYGFALILTSYLLGLAIGAYLVKRWPPQHAKGALFAFAIAMGVVWVYSAVTPFWDLIPLMLVRFWWSPFSFSFGTLMLVNFSVILVLTLALTTAFGYTLPALAAALPKATSASIGRLFAANTLGAVIGAPLAGFILLRYLGLNFTLLVLGAWALLAAAAAAVVSRPRQIWSILVPVPFLLALPFLLPPPDRSIMNAGMYNRPNGFKPDARRSATPSEAAHRLGKIIYQKDSLTARVTVRAVSPMQMSFVINGKPDGSTSLVDMYTQIFMAHLPALMHPNPQDALVIGLGTGTTTGCMALHPGIREIHVAEIEPAQIDVARYFGHHNYRVMDNPKVHMHLDDARHFLLTDTRTYDIIVSEPSNLWVSGMVNLFTKEFYESVRAHLNDGGVFFQWIHYYRVAQEDVRGMLRTFQSVFPNTTFWMHQFGDGFLMARKQGVTIDVDQWEERLKLPVLARDLRRIQLVPPTDMLGFFLWGPEDVRRYTKGSRVCTDDFPYLEFTTPRMRYNPKTTQERRIHMQMFGPLEPMPLVNETAARRLYLGNLFFGRGSLMRAKTELQQALVLDPGSTEARRQLDKLEEIARGI